MRNRIFALLGEAPPEPDWQIDDILTVEELADAFDLSKQAAEGWLRRLSVPVFKSPFGHRCVDGNALELLASARIAVGEPVNRRLRG